MAFSSSSSWETKKKEKEGKGLKGFLIPFPSPGFENMSFSVFPLPHSRKPE